MLPTAGLLTDASFPAAVWSLRAPAEGPWWQGCQGNTRGQKPSQPLTWPAQRAGQGHKVGPCEDPSPQAPRPKAPDLVRKMAVPTVGTGDRKVVLVGPRSEAGLNS